MGWRSILGSFSVIGSQVSASPSLGSDLTGRLPHKSNHFTCGLRGTQGSDDDRDCWAGSRVSSMLYLHASPLLLQTRLWL